MLLLAFTDNGSVLKKFLDETANMSADERAKHLEKNEVRFKHKHGLAAMCFC